MVFTPILSGSGLAGYAYLNRTREDQQERLAQSTQVRQDLTEFTSKLDTIQTSEDLMDNRMMLRVALGAFGLDEDLDSRVVLWPCFGFLCAYCETPAEGKIPGFGCYW